MLKRDFLINVSDITIEDSSELAMRFQDQVLVPRFQQTRAGSRVPLYPEQKLLEVSLVDVDTTFTISTKDLSDRKSLILRIAHLEAVATAALKESYGPGIEIKEGAFSYELKLDGVIV